MFVVARDAISMAVAAVATMLIAVPIFVLKVFVGLFLFSLECWGVKSYSPFADSSRGCKVMDYSVSCRLFRAVFPHPNPFKHLYRQ